MKTNTEISKEIRAELKAAGYNARRVGVSVRDCGYSTSVDITIKDPTVNIKDIENVVNHHEHVDHDERTFEVLEGANTYVFVAYKYGLFDEAAKQYIEEAEQALKTMSEEHQSVVPIRERLRLVKTKPLTVETVKLINGQRYTDQPRIVGSVQELAKYIAMYELAGTIE